MSTHAASTTKRLTAPDILASKSQATPLVVLTAYGADIAALADRHAECIIVGDSLGMVLYGMDSTLGVSLPMMAAHGRAVVNHSSRACIVVDMPFGCYQQSKEQAFESAALLMRETGCQAVKLEGGAVMAETVAFLVARGIPVMGHIGLMPQYIQTLGGFRSQGHSEAAEQALLADAAAIADAGAFSVVLEGIAEPVARQITATIAVPTIGIGASPACDGQVLVTEDLLGLTPRQPKFVKKYAELRQVADKALAEYAGEVRKRDFPAAAHCYQKRG